MVPDPALRPSAVIFSAAPGIGDLVVRIPAIRAVARHYEVTLILTFPESMRGFAESFFPPEDGIRFLYTGKYQKHFWDRYLAFFTEAGRFFSFRDRYEVLFLMADSNSPAGVAKLSILSWLLAPRARKFAIRPRRFHFPGFTNLELPDRIHKLRRFERFAEAALGLVGKDPGHAENDILAPRTPPKPPGSPKVVTLIPGSKMPSRRWPFYRKLAAMLAEEHPGTELQVVGSADERDLVLAVAGSVARPIIGASLLEVRALLEESDAVVCNDSGLMHVSVRLGRETVLLCGGEIFEVWCDYQVPHLRPLRHMVECYPCRLWTCSHQSCLAGIPVERVADEIRAILGR